ncbi:hypothetical protein [Pseudobutyrivibrio ruminis]|uniref:hypothetical protein n=1 Tax=Pseudobutyrivibrio ruminis TaxID=46206 RepID=UPI00051B69BD|nr:hypothetical protein [Pseudobutyrivibrio ruminis]
MRKNILSFGMAIIMGAAMFVGCGKTEDEKAAENLGISLEEYQELKEFISDDEDLYEESDDVVDEDMDESKVEEEEPVVLTYDASDEIKNARFTDLKFQVDDLVVTVNYSEGVTDMLNQFPSDVYTFKNVDHEDVNMSKLVTTNGQEKVYVYNNNQPDEAGWLMCVDVQNLGDSTCDLSECNVVGMDLNKYYDGSIYFAKGIPLNADVLASDEAFSYENLPTLIDSYDLESWDAHCSEEGTENCGRQFVRNENDGMIYTIETYGPEDKIVWCGDTWGEMHLNNRCYYTITLRVDSDTRACNEISFYFGSESVWE